MGGGRLRPRLGARHIQGRGLSMSEDPGLWAFIIGTLLLEIAVAGTFVWRLCRAVATDATAPEDRKAT